MVSLFATTILGSSFFLRERFAFQSPLRNWEGLLVFPDGFCFWKQIKNSRKKKGQRSQLSVAFCFLVLDWFLDVTYFLVFYFVVSFKLKFYLLSWVSSHKTYDYNRNGIFWYKTRIGIGFRSIFRQLFCLGLVKNQETLAKIC